MILTGRSPRLRADNHLDALTDEVDDNASVEVTAIQFLEKVQLIAGIHENVLLNVEQYRRSKTVHMRTDQASIYSKDWLLGSLWSR
jgi:hypothetical protein